MNQPEAQASSANGRRRTLMLVLTAIFVLAGLAAGAWWLLVGRHFEATDDAYVAGHVVQVTPQVAGLAQAILADDTDYVKAGAPLVQLDTADGRVRLEQAEAQLAETVRETRALFSNEGALAAATVQRETELQKAREDLARRKSLAGTGAVTAEELEHAATAVKAGEAALNAAREAQAGSKALTDRTSIERHPRVLKAAASVEEAWLAYARSAVLSPVSGFVARRSVQAGQRVAPGTPLMAVVPLDKVWVEANFKEVQLRNMRIGQPVKLTADVYGAGVEFHGKVAGLGAGTGAAFALLPAQNATGNWIKVVQRVPVRIQLEPKELAEHPLRVGLSVLADVDITDRSGPALASAPRVAPVVSTEVYAADAVAARARVAKLIAAALRNDPAPALEQK